MSDDQLALFPNYVPDTDKNPMVWKYNRTEGKKCKQCALLIKDTYHNKAYYKCQLRGISRSMATDHRINWNACGQFKEKER